MHAMILAAGRGRRMGDLSQEMPKPLLKIHDKYLIEYALTSLRQANVKKIIINVSYHAEKIQAALGDNYGGIEIVYSVEEQALETGGGIFQALPLLGPDPFIVISADIITDYPLRNLAVAPQDLAHLVLVNNPDFHPQGDYSLLGNKVQQSASNSLTYASLGIFRPEIFSGCSGGIFPLSKMLNPAIANQKVTGEIYLGEWHNVGTPQQIQQLNTIVS